MDQLLGYDSGSASSDDDGSRPNITGVSVSTSIDKQQEGRLPSAQQDGAERPSKRAKAVADTQGAHAPGHPAPPHAGTRPGAARAAAAGPAAPLPSPLALLEASTDEERHALLAAPPAGAARAAGGRPAGATAAAVLPAPLLTAPARVRAFPHVAGNFPTVVLLPVHGLDEALDGLYRKVRRLLPDLEPMAAEPGPGNGARPPAQAGYHISLSRCVAVRHPQIGPLAEQLQKELAGAAGPIPLALRGLRAMANDGGTRSFVAAMVAEPGAGQLVSLIRAVDRVFGRHGLPPFYEDPLPHVSVGWVPGEATRRMAAALRRLGLEAGPPVVPEGAAGEEEAGQAQAGQAQAWPQTAGGGRQAGEDAAASGARRNGELDGTGQERRLADGALAGAGGGRGGRGDGPDPVSTDAASQGGAAAGPAQAVLCSWQAARAVCVVGQREYEVWRAAGGRA